MRPRRHAEEDQTADVDAGQEQGQHHRRREHLEDRPHIPEDSLRERADLGSGDHLPATGALLPIHVPDS